MSNFSLLHRETKKKSENEKERRNDNDNEPDEWHGKGWIPSLLCLLLLLILGILDSTTDYTVATDWMGTSNDDDNNSILICCKRGPSTLYCFGGSFEQICLNSHREGCWSCSFKGLCLNKSCREAQGVNLPGGVELRYLRWIIQSTVEWFSLGKNPTDRKEFSHLSWA